jgi:hypothetical protein
MINRIRDVAKIAAVKRELAKARRIKQDLSFNRFLGVDIGCAIARLERDLILLEGYHR